MTDLHLSPRRPSVIYSVARRTALAVAPIDRASRQATPAESKRRNANGKF